MILRILKVILGIYKTNSVFRDRLNVEFSENGTEAVTTDILRFNWASYESTWQLEIVVPFGFYFDGATVPRAFWFYASPWAGRWNRAAAVHDYSLKMNLFSRQICDLIFLDALLAAGCSRRRSALMYLAVRAYSCSRLLFRRR